LATLPATTIELYDNFLPALRAAQPSDALVADVECRLVRTLLVGDSELSKSREPGRAADDDEDLDKQYKGILEAVTCEGRIYVPTDALLCNKVICLFHDNPESGHF